MLAHRAINYSIVMIPLDMLLSLKTTHRKGPHFLLFPPLFTSGNAGCFVALLSMIRDTNRHTRLRELTKI